MRSRDEVVAVLQLGREGLGARRIARLTGIPVSTVRDWVVVPMNRVQRLLRKSSYVDKPEPSHVEISAYSKSWPCLFPQHGPGRKHLRTIRLVDWQTSLLRRYPETLLRGLIHSDGSRFVNTGRGGWRCPRYVFNNESDDIRRIFCDACDVLELRYTFAPRAVYVSRKADVARLDEFIGPKS